ncbi:MAG: hypothetical protein GWP03_05430 [Proteobacteria bacterium]|nr:hypothetical protein [Pseudomonadota bacterium]
MKTTFLILSAFFIGAIPFSVLTGYILLNKDIRTYGDGNPGAGNAWIAGGWISGIPGTILDFSKGFFPAFIAIHKFNLTGWELVAVALAPVLGHAFSPFLKFKGGKAVAATFGMWTALDSLRDPLTLAIFIGIIFALQSEDSWSVIMGMFFFLLYLSLKKVDIYITSICIGNIIILLMKHHYFMKRGMRLRPYIKRFFM